LSDAITLNAVKVIIKEYANKYKAKPEEINNVVNTTLRILTNYNNADISKEGIRKIISSEVAERYALAWANAQKEKVADKNAYL
jgi:hypothetical protein